MKTKDIFNDFLKIFFRSNNIKNRYYNLDYVKKIQSFSKNDKWRNEVRSSINSLKIGSIKNGLDVGCNAGHGTEFLGKLLNIKMNGIDISSVAINDAKKNLSLSKNDYAHYDGKTFPFKSNFFEFISSFHVIGHVLDPIKFVNELNRVLKPNHYVLMITPNAYYKLLALLDSLINLYKPDKSVIKYWFPNEIKKLLIKNNFKEVNIKFLGEMPIMLKPFSFLKIFKSRLIISAKKK